MKNLLIVIASQDYLVANHKGLWDEYSNDDEEYVIIVNLPADFLVSKFRNKQYRIDESRRGLTKITDKLAVIRLLFILRPEILPRVFYPLIAKSFWKQLENNVNFTKYSRVRLLIYNPLWVKILYNTKKNIDICYYLYDEVRYFAHSQKINKKKFRLDKFACTHSQIVLTMTDRLRNIRLNYTDKIITFGNGASIPHLVTDPKIKLPNSVAFIGNFRNWINNDLLEAIIQECPDRLFVFAGSVENDMRPFFIKLLNNYTNTVYLGQLSKEKVYTIYKMVSCVIVPYRENLFTSSTRPIKIVESVMVGCPVVTIPMSGYKESSFIRFASEKDQFLTAIEEVIANPIDQESQEYISFCEENSWKIKARRLKSILDDIRNED